MKFKAAKFTTISAGLLLGSSLFAIDAHAQWTGLYFGAGAGYGAATHTAGFEIYDYDLGGLFQIGGPTGFDVFSIGASADFGGRGVIGTVQAGFDLQLGSRLVAGIFTDYTLSRINSNFSAFGDVCYEPTDCDTATISDRPVAALDILTGSGWSIGGRLGILATPRVLLYGLGAWTHTNMIATASLTSIPTGPLSMSSDPMPVNGVTFGGGVETLLTRNLSAKIEYRGTLWNQEATLGTPTEGIRLFDAAYVQTIRGTLSVRLGGPGEEPAQSFDGAAADWTGFHVGAGGGYGLVTHNGGFEIYDYDLGGLFQIGGPTGFDVFSIGASADFGGRGAIGTVDGGFDVQVGDHFVMGLLADYTFSRIYGDISAFGDVCYEPTDCDTAVVSDRPVVTLDLVTGNNWSLGGRFGLLATDRSLFYGLGAFTRTELIATASLVSIPTGPLSTSSDPVNMNGVTFGAGVETLLTPSVSAKFEYRGTLWSDENVLGTPTEGVRLFEDSLVQTVRGTLSFRFGNR